MELEKLNSRREILLVYVEQITKDNTFLEQIKAFSAVSWALSDSGLVISPLLSHWWIFIPIISPFNNFGKIVDTQ